MEPLPGYDNSLTRPARDWWERDEDEPCDEPAEDEDGAQ